jgi:hypothetical protein
MRYLYKQFNAPFPIIGLGGRLHFPRPIIPVTIVGAQGGASLVDALVDSGSDETLFDERDAHRAGIDLTNAPIRPFGGIVLGGHSARFAQVTLRLSDGIEYHEWTAWVGFGAGLRRSVLGFCGVMQFFTTTFFGDDEAVELTVNRLYPGT